MGDWGAKVTTPGHDISSTTPEDFAFNSKFGSVKIAQEPEDKVPMEVTVNGSTTLTLTIEHNLGFIPLAMIFAERTPSSGRYYFGAVIHGPEDVTDTVSVDGGAGFPYLDETDLVIKFTNPKVTSQMIKLYYFIFGDSAE